MGADKHSKVINCSRWNDILVKLVYDDEILENFQIYLKSAVLDVRTSNSMFRLSYSLDRVSYARGQKW